jgi:hypothetical protein
MWVLQQHLAIKLQHCTVQQSLTPALPPVELPGVTGCAVKLPGPFLTLAERRLSSHFLKVERSPPPLLCTPELLPAIASAADILPVGAISAVVHCH